MDAVTCRTRISLTCDAPRRARSWARRVSALDPPTEEILLLLVSELVSNSVRHSGGSPGDEVGILMRQAGDRVHVEVQDPGDGPVDVRQPSADHLGLRLVESLAYRWGVRQDPTTVWFDLSR
jgi:two-component sensor histidine kinase